MSPLLLRIGETLFNPIMVKELRAGTRGLRYFFTHLLIMLLVGFVLLCVLGFASEAAGGRRGGSGEDPSDIGRYAFLSIQILQFSVAFLVVPAFTATSIVQERDQNTYDILMSSTLSPWQIAWGKLTAAMTQVGLIFISIIPLVSLTFLFGGVSFRQVLFNYAALFITSLCLSTWALSISASVKSTLRAVIGVYAGVMLLALLAWALLGALAGAGILGNMVAAWGFVASPEMAGRRLSMRLGPWQELLYLYVYPVAISTIWAWFFLMHTASRLKPFFADRARPYRLFYLGTTAILFALAFLSFAAEMAAESAEMRAAVMASFAIGLGTLLSMGAFFSCEDPVLAPYLREKYAALTPRWRWLRVFKPGAGAGDRFTVFASLFFVALAVACFLPYAGGFGTKDWAGSPDWLPLVLGVGSVLPWIYFLSGLGVLLGSTMRNWQTLSRVTLAIVSLVLALLPLIHWGVTVALRYSYRESAAVTTGSLWLAMSPVPPIITGLMPQHGADWLPLYVNFLGFAVPLHAVYLLFCGGFGTLFRIFAYRKIRQIERA